MDVVFSAPEQLQMLRKKANSDEKEPPVSQGTPSSVRTKCYLNITFCIQNAIYLVPLSCKRAYFGPTGHCINQMLKQHHYNAAKVFSGHLGMRCRKFGYIPLRKKNDIFNRAQSKMPKEISETDKIRKK